MRRFFLKCIVSFGLLSVLGCESNPVAYSSRLTGGVVTQNTLDVYYVDRNLVSKDGKANSSQKEDTSPVNNHLARFGYFDIGPKLIEFGPNVLKTKGLQGTFQHVLENQFSSSTITRSNTKGNPLVLEFRHGRVVRTNHVVTAYMLVAATLFDTTGAKRIWTGQFHSTLGNDPALGILKVTTVDQRYIEELMSLVLDQMAKDGVIALSGNKAETANAK